MKPLEVTWSEHYPTTCHRAEVTVTKTEDGGTSRSGRALGTYEVRAGDVVVGTVTSAEQTLYRKVGRLSNPSGRAVRWSWTLHAPSSDAYTTWSYDWTTRLDVLRELCRHAARAGVLKGTEIKRAA